MMGRNALKWLGMFLVLCFSGSACAGSIACRPNSNPACLAPYPIEFSGGGIPSDIGIVQFSSPAVARLGLINDAEQDIVVGTTGGYVIAYHADGTLLWWHKTGNVAVQSKPAIADIDGDGKPEIVVGAGDTNALGGGVYVLHNDGTLKCAFATSSSAAGVYSSPALGRLDNTRPNEMQIVFGSFDQHIRALHADCSLWWIKGIADDVIDTVWSSPALYDLDGDGQLDVLIGQDSGHGTLPNGVQVGGQVRAFRGNGVGELPGFPKKLEDVVYSSPAIGDISGTGKPAIAVGYGHCWDLPGCAPGGAWHTDTDEAVYAWNASGANLAAAWPYPTPGEASRTDSPALADLDGDGKLETIIGTLNKATPPAVDQYGNMLVIRSDGTAYPGWPQQTWIAFTCSANVQWLDAYASPIAVDINGDGFPEILAVAAVYVMVWDRSGNLLSRVAPGVCGSGTPASYYQMQSWYAIQSTPTAADLFGDGKIELVVASANGAGNLGALYVWQFANSSASMKSMPWPQFRHDALNTGVYRGDEIFKNGFD